MNQNNTRKEPEYYYRRNKGDYVLYRDNFNGTADSIDRHWNEEVIRKKVYELNGWEYKPKTIQL